MASYEIVVLVPMRLRVDNMADVSEAIDRVKAYVAGEMEPEPTGYQIGVIETREVVE